MTASKYATWEVATERMSMAFALTANIAFRWGTNCGSDPLEFLVTYLKASVAPAKPKSWRFVGSVR